MDNGYLPHSSEYYQIAKSAVIHALGREHEATQPQYLKVRWADEQQIRQMNPGGLSGKTLVVELTHPSLDGVVTALSHNGSIASTYRNGNGFSNELVVDKTYQRAIASGVERLKTSHTSKASWIGKLRGYLHL